MRFYNKRNDYKMPSLTNSDHLLQPMFSLDTQVILYHMS